MKASICRAALWETNMRRQGERYCVLIRIQHIIVMAKRAKIENAVK